MIDEYSNEKKPSDGEVYWKIRQYEREGNLFFKKRWLDRLSDNGKKRLTQLFRHDDLTKAFDDVLRFPGLRSGMKISVLHRVIGGHCKEQVLHYLRRIPYVWLSKLLDEDAQAIEKVDEFTVKAVELKAPSSSRLDAAKLKGQLSNGQIFGAFSQQERDRIFTKLMSISGLIPSLYSFFEDFKYLEACATSVKRLVKLSPFDTVFTALDHAFEDVNQEPGQVKFQEAESTVINKPGRLEDRFNFGVRQIWIGAMRDHRNIPGERKKDKKNLLAKERYEEADDQVLCEFAALADQLGFASDQIQSLKARSSDREIARKALLKARKPGRYSYNDNEFEGLVRRISDIFRRATPLEQDRPRPELVSDDPDAVGNRCGFPDEMSHEQDRNCLFIGNLHDGREDKGEMITSYYVRRSVYFAFFGKHDPIGPSSSDENPESKDNSTQEVVQSYLDMAAENNEIQEEVAPEAARDREGFTHWRQALASVEDADDMSVEDASYISTVATRRRSHIDLEQNTTIVEVPPPESLVSGTALSQEPIPDQLAVDLIHSASNEPLSTEQAQLQRTYMTLPPPTDDLLIEWMVCENYKWRRMMTMPVAPSDPESKVERYAGGIGRNQYYFYDMDLHRVGKEKCLATAINSAEKTGRYYILCLPQEEVDISAETVKSLSQILPSSPFGMELVVAPSSNTELVSTTSRRRFIPNKKTRV